MPRWIAYNGKNADIVPFCEGSMTMRYLAQFSEAPQTRTQAFWRDAVATEEWLGQEGRYPSAKKIVMRARGMRALEPWLPFQTEPLVIDAWLDPMEIAVTWSYLMQFLAELGPERIWIPCGDDSWVGWSNHRLTIRAARDSWLWVLAEDVWDPASWSDRDELEWWSEGRLQHVVRLPWGISEQRSWSTGWDEWTLRAESSQLNELWKKLAHRLGARPVRVKWQQERPPRQETLLGLKSRYIACDLICSAHGGNPWLTHLSQSPEPLYVRAQAVWSVPEWTADWSTLLTLRRVQRGTRLEATYVPRRSMEKAAWKSLQQDRRHIPILQIRPLVTSVSGLDTWERLTQESISYQHQERLTKYLKEAGWPIISPPSKRIRLTRGWSIKRWASQAGLWVVSYNDQLEVSIEWPTEVHPGNIGVSVVGSTPIAMNEWVRASRFQRLNRDRRYWAHWIVSVLLPLLQKAPLP